MLLTFQPDRSCIGFGYIAASPVFLFWPHIYIAPEISRQISMKPIHKTENTTKTAITLLLPAYSIENHLQKRH